jgi:histidine triad (HIT) family protein
MADEQAALSEKLGKMSPEEMKEYQKKNCIFCQIIKGNVASKKIYSDDKVIAVLDINPANPGHLLVMPKEHYAIMPLIPEQELAHIAMVSKALSHALLKVLKVDGTTIFTANGTAAGQKAQHFMLHIIPRKEGDSVGLMIPQNNISEQNMLLIQQRLVERINELFGIKQEISEKQAFAKNPEEKKEPEKSKPKVVEAEFKEKKNEKSEKKRKEKEEVNLDDISSVLLGK